MEKGFTLIEILVTLGIFFMLIFGISAMLNDIFIKSSQQLSSLSNIDQARATLNTFTNEIRDAVYGLDGSYPLNKAVNSEIIFFSNYKIANGKIARIRYYVSDGILYKGVVLPTGNPFTYNLSSEKIIPVASGIANGAAPAFYYYSGGYDGTVDNFLTPPVNINQVRYVKINLSVLNQTKSQNTSTFIIAAGAAMRSVKDNLGD